MNPEIVKKFKDLISDLEDQQVRELTEWLNEGPDAQDTLLLLANMECEARGIDIFDSSEQD
jgi:hypothetical protein